MIRLPPLLLSFLWVLLSAPVSRAEPPGERLRLTVVPLEANEVSRDEAEGVTALLVSHLSESSRLEVRSPDDPEAGPTAGACESGTCPERASEVPRPRYELTGRLDRFGSRYVLTTTLVEVAPQRVLARPRAEIPGADALPRAAERIANQLLAALAVAAPGDEAPEAEPLLGEEVAPVMSSTIVALRLNNSFISRLASLNPGADIELGYGFHPEWMGFVQVGFSYIRASDEGRDGSLSVLPNVLGVRHYHRVEHALRPYWGLGLGVQLAFGEFGIFQQTGPLPTVIGFGGVEYLIGQVGLQFEAGTNVAQATLGLAGDGLGRGLNLDLNLGASYHF